MEHNVNVITKTIKIIEENIGVNLYDLQLGKAFLNMTIKTQATTTKKTDKLDCIRIKTCML